MNTHTNAILLTFILMASLSFQAAMPEPVLRIAEYTESEYESSTNNHSQERAPEIIAGVRKNSNKHSFVLASGLTNSGQMYLLSNCALSTCDFGDTSHITNDSILNHSGLNQSGVSTITGVVIDLESGIVNETRFRIEYNHLVEIPPIISAYFQDHLLQVTTNCVFEPFEYLLDCTNRTSGFHHIIYNPTTETVEEFSFSVQEREIWPLGFLLLDEGFLASYIIFPAGDEGLTNISYDRHSDQGWWQHDPFGNESNFDSEAQQVVLTRFDDEGRPQQSKVLMKNYRTFRENYSVTPSIFEFFSYIKPVNVQAFPYIHLNSLSRPPIILHPELLIVNFPNTLNIGWNEYELDGKLIRSGFSTPVIALDHDFQLIDRIDTFSWGVIPKFFRDQSGWILGSTFSQVELIGSHNLASGEYLVIIEFISWPIRSEVAEFYNIYSDYQSPLVNDSLVQYLQLNVSSGFSFLNGSPGIDEPEVFSLRQLVELNGSLHQLIAHENSSANRSELILSPLSADLTNHSHGELILSTPNRTLEEFLILIKDATIVFDEPERPLMVIFEPMFGYQGWDAFLLSSGHIRDSTIYSPAFTVHDLSSVLYPEEEPIEPPPVVETSENNSANESELILNPEPEGEIVEPLNGTENSTSTDLNSNQSGEETQTNQTGAENEPDRELESTQMVRIASVLTILLTLLLMMQLVREK